ncbi:MAG: exodeoxyribonuclease VII small subunit [Paraprevotella sp.]|nr:exodeoxyribonuclease VII small subunit [Paraprevotella sp.]
MGKEKMTYEQAMLRLEDIVRQVERGETSIDSLTELLKEAKQLIAYCKDKLYATEEEIKKVLADDEK